MVCLATIESASVGIDSATVRNAVDIVDVITSYGIALKPEGSNFKGLCPFHDDRTPSFTVSPSYQNYKCWACSANGDVFTFVQQMDRISFREAMVKLAERAGIPLDQHFAQRKAESEPVYQALAWAEQTFAKFLLTSPAAAEAREYLKERGLKPITIEKHRIGFAPDAFDWLISAGNKQGFSDQVLLKAGLVKASERGGKHYDVFRGRIQFPIRDERKRVVGFGGRILPRLATDAGAKYLNTPATEVYNKSKILYGLDVAGEALRHVRNSETKRIVVMEGYTDCLMAYQHGFPFAVASCGTALTVQHVSKLTQFADQVILMFDGDAAGIKAARNAIELLLGTTCDLRLCVLPDNLDPCDFLLKHGVEPFLEHLRSATDALDWTFKNLRERIAGGSLENRRVAVDEMLALLANIPESGEAKLRIKLQMAYSRLAPLAGLDEPSMRARIDEIRAGQNRLSNQSAPATLAPSLAEAVKKPIPTRERKLVQWMVCRPSQAHQLLEAFPTNRYEHPITRRLAELCAEVDADFAQSATCEHLRERAGDPMLDGLLVEFMSNAPNDDEFARGLLEIKQALKRHEQRAWKQEVTGDVADKSDASEHLRWLKLIRDRANDRREDS